MSSLQEPQPQISRPGEEAIRLVPYRRDESQLPSIMRLISAELSEPYSIYTYRYFIHNWPELCYLAEESSTGDYMGVIVCKLDKSQNGYCTGYIAMLAVEMRHRRKGIGTRLVQRAIDAMEKEGCDEVVLETEVSNTSALNLYGQLGFIREKRLLRYYLNGVDAFRLKLYLTDRTSDCGVGDALKDGGGTSRSNDAPPSSQQVMQQPVI